jgi:hypothetical protein
MPSPASASAGTSRRFAAVGFGVVFALLLAEGTFRVLDLGAPPIVKCRLRRDDWSPGELVYHCYPSNPNGEFQPTPDVSRGEWHLTRLLIPTVPLPLNHLPQTPWCVEYRTEIPPIRGPAPTAEPRPGVVRFAGIGDSFAMGEGVPYDKTLFVRLAALLGGGYEILNCGVGGFDTGGDIIQMEHVVPGYRCARALVVFNLNDVAFAPDAREKMEATFDLMNLRAPNRNADSRPWYRRVSRVAEYFGAAADVRQVTEDTVAAYLDAYDSSKNAPNLAILEAQFRRLAQWPDCRVGLVVYPMMYGLEGPYPLQPCHDTVVRLARAAGLPALDLAPSFAGKVTTSLQVHPIDHHPNGRAHEIAAKAIAPWILGEPSLR